MGTYIALQAIQVGTKDDRRSIEPASQDGKHSGLFEHEFDRATEKRLLDAGAIRLPEGVEVHLDPTEVEVMDDTRAVDAQVIAAETTPTPAAVVAEPTPVVEPVGDDLEAKTVAELKAVAEAEQIELADITKKADIIAAIRAARSGEEDLLG